MDGDIDLDFLTGALGSTVACDIETTGLDPRRDAIATVQLSCDEQIRIIRVGDHAPVNLLSLLEDPLTLKIFHHAPFDLVFISTRWGAEARRVACTKVAAKLAEPGLFGDNYSLQSLLARHLGVHISKAEQVSDWTQRRLTKKQLAYASNDVVHLEPLLHRLLDILRQHNRLQLAQDCFDFLPTLVRARTLGAQSLFEH